MNDYQTALKTVKALQFNKSNLVDLFTFIGTFLRDLPGNNNPRPELYKIANLLARAKHDSYIVFVDDKFVNMGQVKFENNYTLVE